MPKIISAAQESILAFARQMLLEGGYEALTIRAVASRVGIAVGTVYNYYRSKDLLVASVMLEDWTDALHRMEAGAEAAPNLMTGLEEVYSQLLAFCHTYAAAWAQYTVRPGSAGDFHARHRMLLDQLCRVLEPLLGRFDALFCPQTPEFLAQSMLTAASGDEAPFEWLRPIMTQLFHIREKE